MTQRRRRVNTIRVAVVDDSTFIRKALERVLGEQPQLTLVGSARSGEELLAHLDEWRPDVITLDLDMPGMSGLSTLDHIMATRPVPVIILSTHSGDAAPLTIEALHRGAVDFIDKQRYSLVDFEALRTVLLDKIFHVTNTEPETDLETTLAQGEESSVEIPDLSEWVARLRDPDLERRMAFDVIAIGASTGGPPAIERVLTDLGAPLQIPVLIVQHMPAGFTQAFAERLNANLPHLVCEARHGEPAQPGTVYIAPAGWHLRLGKRPEGLVLELGDQPKTTHSPSVDVLFRSVARVAGPRTIGILLTGMGSDGARGLARLRDLGAHTVAQDESSSVVYGMPRAARAIGAVDDVLDLDAIGPRVRALLERQEDL